MNEPDLKDLKIRGLEKTIRNLRRELSLVRHQQKENIRKLVREVFDDRRT